MLGTFTLVGVYDGLLLDGNVEDLEKARYIAAVVGGYKGTIEDYINRETDPELEDWARPFHDFLAGNTAAINSSFTEKVKLADPDNDPKTLLSFSSVRESMLDIGKHLGRNPEECIHLKEEREWFWKVQDAIEKETDDGYGNVFLFIKDIDG